MRTVPDRSRLVVGFAHAAYRLHDCFARRAPDIAAFEVRTADALRARIAEPQVLCLSGLWRNELLALAPQLAFVQSVSAGTDQFARPAFAAAGIGLASAQGVNERAVAEHALALMLALARQLPQALAAQAQRQWLGAIGDPALRQATLGGRTLVVFGMGRIGARLGRLARAFGMHVVGVRREVAAGGDAADEWVASADWHRVLPRADVLALTCPLTPETTGIVDAGALAALKPGAWLVNVARGRVVDQPALAEALGSGRLGAAALDCVWDEPLPPGDPLWSLPRVLITPHVAGESQDYEEGVIDLLLGNLESLWRGEGVRLNRVV